jgi:hypothetical protein
MFSDKKKNKMKKKIKEKIALLNKIGNTVH